MTIFFFVKMGLHLVTCNPGYSEFIVYKQDSFLQLSDNYYHHDVLVFKCNGPYQKRFEKLKICNKHDGLVTFSMKTVWLNQNQTICFDFQLQSIALCLPFDQFVQFISD